MEVETAKIETAGSDLLLPRRGLIRRDLTGADPVPKRKDSKRDRPIAGILPNRGIPVVHQLIAVVFKFLAEEVQHRPAFMESRAAQAVLPGESRNGGSWLGCAENENDQRKCSGQQRNCPLLLLTEVRLRPHTHACL